MMFSSDEEGAADNLNAEETSVEGDLGNVEVMNPVGATSASRSSRKSGVSGKEVWFAKLPLLLGVTCLDKTCLETLLRTNTRRNMTSDISSMVSIT